jgi:hypothetical protein
LKIAAFTIALLAASGFAIAVESGNGKFQSKSVAFDLGGAVAFRGTSTLNAAEPAIIVAISNRNLVATLSDYIDRRRAIDSLVKNDETAVVYFEFTPEGRYRGLSYYFEPGNGCKFCSGDVESTVKLVNGKLAGTLAGTEKGRPFNVSLDVTVMGDDHGAALPPDGGAPGKAYLAYHAALGKRDPVALRPTLTSGKMAIWDRSKKNGELAEYLDYLAKQHLLTSVRIKKAWSRADVANLLVEGDGPAGTLSGEVLLLREKGAWVVDSEVLVN